MADPTPTNPANAAKQVVSQLRGLWTKLPRLARAGAVGVLLVVIGAVAYTTLSAGPEGWVAVAPTMSAEDVVDVSSLLASRGVPQRVSANGKRVEVPASRATEARMIASASGYPRRGGGNELFQKSGIGDSAFKEQALFNQATQGELERSIESLAPVENARVHVAQGKRSVFRDADEPPTASVLLQLRPGSTLSADQVRGVKELIASSTTGLTDDHVAVIDGHGNVLSADDGRDSHDGADAAAIEATISAKLHELLDKIVHEGHFAVTVAVEMDRSHVSQSEEIYDPTRSAILSEARSGTADPGTKISSGIAGTQGNLPGAAAPSGGTTTGGGIIGTETINHQNTRTVRTTDQPEARVARIQVAILLDHQRDAAGHLAALPQSELDRIASLASHSAGLDEKRGDSLEVQSFAFAPEAPIAPPLPSIEPSATPLIPPLPVPLPLAAGAVGGFVLLVIVALMLRGARKRRRVAVPVLALPAPLAEIERALDLPPGERAALPGLAAAATDQRSLEERVLGSVRSDVPRAARVLAAWLVQPDPRPSKS